MTSSLSRRSFLGGLAAASAAAASKEARARAFAPIGAAPRRPVVIASANGWWDEPERGSAVATTMRALLDPETAERPYGLLEAIVEGVGVTESDARDHSVGLGGLPNEDGVVQLDASCMFGPNHRAGAVGALENVRHAARVAMNVLRYTDHSFLVGKGAYEFARAFGMPHEELLTEEARKIWLYWRQSHSAKDDWFTPPDAEVDPDVLDRFTTGTIHLSAVDARGDVASVTTTSGLSFKIPGRVGDSPIVGAGMFCDNDIGGAGATGRGEEAIANCGAFSIVDEMGRDVEPTEACLNVLKRVARHAERRGFWKDGRPDFQLKFYAVRKDGAYGSACMLEGGAFAVMTGEDESPRHEECAFLYEKR